MLAGCYTLDLYCDNPNHVWEYHEFPDQYFHELGSVCRQAARKRGWKFTKDRLTGDPVHICPKCSGKKVKG
jgi:hypothetical protein